MKRLSGFLLILLALSTSACTHRLTVTSVPTDARVQINGTEYGSTPLELTRLQRGRYEIAVRAPGHQDWRSELEIATDQEVHAVLAPLPPPVERVVTRVERLVPETRLAVFTEPANAEVTIDGRLAGVSRIDEPVTVVFGQPPTAAEIIVEKAGFERWTKAVSLEVQRENRVFVKLNPLPAWHTFTSDGELLRQAVQQVVAATRNLPTLARDQRLAVFSITHGEGSDEPLQAVVEDALMTTLAQAGFSPAERDDQVLVQLAHSTSGEAIPYRVLTGHANEDYPFIYDAAIRTEETRLEGEPVTVRSTATSRVESGNDCNQTVTTTTVVTETSFTASRERVVSRLEGSIPTADQFLTYRILECGLSKSPVIEGEPRTEPMLHRLAELRVHLRIIDAKTGIVTWAGYLTGRLADEIPSRVSLDLANPPNRFSSEPLPDAWQRLRHAPARHINAVPSGPSSRGAVVLEPRVR